MPRKPKEPEEARLDELLDEALTETFPASDPVSVKCERETPASAGTSGRATADAEHDETGR